LAGLHFTGSTATFELLQRRIADNLERYAQYPRVVGETGGKDFVLVHPSANVDAAIVALVRGAFEYQGQKCSAASRAYVPRSAWARVREGLAAAVAEIAVGDPADFRNFMGAVIDERAFTKHRDAIARARADVGRGVVEVLGGTTDDAVGWFVRPTVIVADDPRYWSMSTELFGPILSVHVYDDASFDDCVGLVRTTSDYGLTGAVFAEDRAVIDDLFVRLRFAAGNFYVNDKPTGAVVGQQPFGGSRKSGTNDKAGAPMNLLRWTSARTIKETFAPPLDYRYPAMEDI
jgi:1-pyrroline-5-carboxylate dehydrogenase